MHTLENEVWQVVRSLKCYIKKSHSLQQSGQIRNSVHSKFIIRSGEINILYNLGGNNFKSRRVLL